MLFDHSFKKSIFKYLRKTAAACLSLSFIFNFPELYSNNSFSQVLPFQKPSSKNPIYESASFENIFLPGMTKGKSYEGSSEKKILLIRDLHCQPEAQEKIAQAVSELSRKGIRQIFMEGAQGPLRTLLYQSFPDQAIREKVAKKFLNEGYLTGAEFAVISQGVESHVELIGVEDSKVYLENFKAFRNTRALYQKVEKEIEAFDQWLDTLKKKSYSKKLLLWDEIQKEMMEKKLSLERAVFLFKNAGLKESLKVKENLTEVPYQKLGIFVGCHPRVPLSWSGIQNQLDSRLKLVGMTDDEQSSLNNLWELVSFKEKIDSSKVQEECAHILKYFQNKLEREELQALIKRGLEYRLGKLSSLQYFISLKEVYEGNINSEQPPVLSSPRVLIGDPFLSGINLEFLFYTGFPLTACGNDEERRAEISFKKQYPQLELWIQFLQKQENINFDVVGSLLSKFIDGKMIEQAKQENVEELVRTDHQWHLLKKWIRLELSRSDFAETAENAPAELLSHFRSGLQSFSTKKSLSPPSFSKNWNLLIQEAEHFYELAQKRDGILLENALKIVKRIW